MRSSPFEHNYQKPPQQPVPVYQQNPNVINQYYPPQYDPHVTQSIRQPPVITHSPQNKVPVQVPVYPQNFQQPNPQNYEMVHRMQHPNVQTYPNTQPYHQYEQGQMPIPQRQVVGEQHQGYEYPEQQYQYEQGQNSQQDSQDVHNQQIILFWEHKFYTIYERFQWVHDKVQWMRTQFYNLNNELKAVDSQNQWNDAKQHHEDYIEQLQQFSQQLTGVLNENQNLLQQREIEGEENGVWKQRYYQLFQSFKVMEQQLIQSKQNKNDSENKEQEDERYQEFVENYRQLQRQYTSVINELQQYKRKDPGSDEVKEYRVKLDYALKQAEKYKDILDRLHEENQEMNGIIEELKEKNNSLQQNVSQGNSPDLEYQLNEYANALQEREVELQRMNNDMEQMHHSYQNLAQKSQAAQHLQIQLNNKNKQVEMLKNNIMELRADHKSVSTVTEEYQRLLKNKYAEIEQKNTEINKLRKQITEPASLVRNESVREVAKRDYDQRIEKLQNEYEERIADLKKKIKEKEKETEMSGLISIKLESSEKKVKLLTQEITSLSENLDEKERENSELKRVSYEAEKLRGIENQYNLLLEERDNLNGALLQKNYDIDNLQTQLNEFQLRIREINQKNINNQSKVLINEIEELNEIIRNKDTEITKLRSSLALKETYAEELEMEVQKTKNSISSLEKYYENEKELSMERIASLQRKNQQIQKKMRELEHEFGANMIKNLEEEIKSLRIQNQGKQENIIRMQGEQLELRSRISHYERIRNSHDSDLEDLTSRIRELENSKSELLRKMEVSFRQIKTKEREMKDNLENELSLKQSLKNAHNQIEESQNLVKEKERVIKQLQDQLSVSNTRLQYITNEHDSLRMRRRDETDVFIKESDDLKRKIFEYEHNSGSQKQLQLRHHQSLSKIENKLVKQLQEENQLLKNELACALEGINSVPTFKRQVPKNKKSAEGINYIQKRLFDFNSKLDDMIIQNQQLNENPNFHNNSKSHHKLTGIKNGENWNGTFKFGQNSNKSQSEDIQTLKSQLNDLRRYCARLQVQAGGQEKQSMVVLEQQKMYNDQCQFYKQKIAQLESRIDNLIEVNTNLKGRLDGLLKGQQQPSSITYYREQLANAEETIDSLNKKLKKVLQENRALRLNSNEATTKLCRNYEDKLFECQNKIFTLQRKLTHLELEKIKGDNERANLVRDLKVSESEIETMKNTLEKKLNKTVHSNDELTMQLRKSQSQMNEMLQKIRLLESQNTRLTQAIHTSMSQQNMQHPKQYRLISTPVRSPMKVTKA